MQQLSALLSLAHGVGSSGRFAVRRPTPPRPRRSLLAPLPHHGRRKRTCRKANLPDPFLLRRTSKEGLPFDKSSSAPWKTEKDLSKGKPSLDVRRSKNGSGNRRRRRSQPS